MKGTYSTYIFNTQCLAYDLNVICTLQWSRRLKKNALSDLLVLKCAGNAPSSPQSLNLMGYCVGEADQAGSCTIACCTGTLFNAYFNSSLFQLNIASVLMSC